MKTENSLIKTGTEMGGGSSVEILTLKVVKRMGAGHSDGLGLGDVKHLR